MWKMQMWKNTVIYIQRKYIEMERDLRYDVVIHKAI